MFETTTTDLLKYPSPNQATTLPPQMSPQTPSLFPPPPTNPLNSQPSFLTAIERLRQHNIWLPTLHLSVTTFESFLTSQNFFDDVNFLSASPTPSQLERNAQWWGRMLQHISKSPPPKVPEWFLKECSEHVKLAGYPQTDNNDEMWEQWLRTFDTYEGERGRELKRLYNECMAFYLENMWPTMDGGKLAKQLQLLPPGERVKYYQRCVQFYKRNMDPVDGGGTGFEGDRLICGGENGEVVEKQFMGHPILKDGEDGEQLRLSKNCTGTMFEEEDKEVGFLEMLEGLLPNEEGMGDGGAGPQEDELLCGGENGEASEQQFMMHPIPEDGGDDGQLCGSENCIGTIFREGDKEAGFLEMLEGLPNEEGTGDDGAARLWEGV
ncbi:hypothetical protein BDD12DRAFT_805275 [Trichophaea hybrida]|nr:hypothetical protein BDD12DRAFT_805275 [Trichophaea hybrida]